MASPSLPTLPFVSSSFLLITTKNKRYSYDSIHNCSRSSQKTSLFLLARPVAFRSSPVLLPLARRIRSQSAAAPASIASFKSPVSINHQLYTRLSLTRDKSESNTGVATSVT